MGPGTVDSVFIACVNTPNPAWRLCFWENGLVVLVNPVF